MDAVAGGLQVASGQGWAAGQGYAGDRWAPSRSAGPATPAPCVGEPGEAGTQPAAKAQQPAGTSPPRTALAPLRVWPCPAPEQPVWMRVCWGPFICF